MASGTLFAQQMGTQLLDSMPSPLQHSICRIGRFAKKAAEGGASEVALGQLAERKGNVSVVRDFGKQMIRDHGNAGEELRAAASSDNIGIADQMNPKDQQLYRWLETLSGQAFDQAYARKMLTDHEHDVAVFRQESKMVRTPP